MSARPYRRAAVFLVVQVGVLACMAALAMSRWQSDEVQRRLPSADVQPAIVAPLYDWPEMLSDEQLRSVLLRLRPTFRGGAASLNDIDHALRFWGLAARFDDPDCLDGDELRQILTDQRRFAEYFGDAKPLLTRTRDGVRVRLQEGKASSSHVDHTLAGLAEVGTPLDYPLVLIDGQATVGDMLHESLARFSLNQVEYEWSGLSYALYGVHAPWFSTEGQQITYDRLAERFMRQWPSQGVCFGNHRLYGLTMFLRLGQERPLLSQAAQEQVMAYLSRMTAELVHNQSAQGFFNGLWGNMTAEAAARSTIPPDSLTARLLVTGHALECWAMSPAELLPPRESLVRAGQWLTRTILELDPRQVRENYTYLTHAGRALALWRQQAPADVLSSRSSGHEPGPIAKPRVPR